MKPGPTSPPLTEHWFYHRLCVDTTAIWPLHPRLQWTPVTPSSNLQMIPPHFRVVCLPRWDAENIFIFADLSWTYPQQITKKAQQRLPGRTQEEQSGPKAACDLLRVLHRECTDILYHSVVQELHRSREKASEDHEHSSEVPAGLVYLQLPQRISRILVLTCLTCCPLPGTSSPSNQGQTDSETVSFQVP